MKSSSTQKQRRVGHQRKSERIPAETGNTIHESDLIWSKYSHTNGVGTVPWAICAAPKNDFIHVEKANTTDPGLEPQANLAKILHQRVFRRNVSHVSADFRNSAKEKASVCISFFVSLPLSGRRKL